MSYRGWYALIATLPKYVHVNSASESSDFSRGKMSFWEELFSGSKESRWENTDSCNIKAIGRNCVNTSV